MRAQLPPPAPPVSQPRPYTRDEQIADALRVTAELREQGWARATVEITRAGTYRVQVEAEGDKVVRHQWRTGRAEK